MSALLAQLTMDFGEFSKYFGNTSDLDYLKCHYPRFCATRDFAYEHWRWGQADILDIGAHWLHQSVLFSLDGHRITAADFRNPLNDPDLRSLASNHDIRLLGYDDLSSERVFDELDDNSMDVVLFCEILEHITFNPVAMWKAIHRVLRPGGSIFITTPNHYSYEKLFRSIRRLVTGWGNGITVSDILHKRTNAPHWKEYSKKELRQYFRLLSSDFSVKDQRYFSYFYEFQKLNWKGRLVHIRQIRLPIFREGFISVIELERKVAGIGIEPGW